MGAPTRTIFFGSGAFGLPLLRRLLDSEQVSLDLVVSAAPRPVGRSGALTPTPVAGLATAAGLSLRTPASLRDEAVIDELRGVAPELIVLADYGRLIPSVVLDLPRHGALNLHPSLLPRHRGATPVAAAILAGDATTGVTLMRMDEGLDTGPILAQEVVPLDGTEVAPDLEGRLAQLGADLLAEKLPAWLGGELEAVAQPEVGSTLTRPLRRADGALDAGRPAVDLERRVRAYQPWPGSFLLTDAGRLIVWRSSVVDADASDVPGSLVADGDGIALATTRGRLRLEEVQPAGKRRMSGPEYRRGHPFSKASV